LLRGIDKKTKPLSIKGGHLRAGKKVGRDEERGKTAGLRSYPDEQETLSRYSFGKKRTSGKKG